MRINFLYKGVLAVAMLCVAPAALPASARGSQPGAGTVKSGKGTFASNASSLLQQVQNDAQRVRNNADQLEARVREPFLSDWQDDGDQLIMIRDRVNDMDKLVYELRVNESRDLPWQEEAKLIDQAIRNFEKYAGAHHQAQRLPQTLGLKSNS